MSQFRKTIKEMFYITMLWAVNLAGAWHLFAPPEHHWMVGWQLWLLLALFTLTCLINFFVYAHRDHNPKEKS